MVLFWGHAALACSGNVGWCCRSAGKFLFASLAIPQPQPVAAVIERTGSDDLLAEFVTVVRVGVCLTERERCEKVLVTDSMILEEQGESMRKISVVIIMSLLVLTSAQSKTEPADIVFKNGNIYTSTTASRTLKRSPSKRARSSSLARIKMLRLTKRRAHG